MLNWSDCHCPRSCSDIVTHTHGVECEHSSRAHQSVSISFASQDESKLLYTKCLKVPWNDDFLVHKVRGEGHKARN